MTYVKDLTEEPAFEQEGLTGYQFPTENKDFEIYYVDVEQGHDTFIVSNEITHAYYILQGKGTFTIEGDNHDVEPDDFVEVPPGVEYTYSGNMDLLLIMSPPWFEGNEEILRENPAVGEGRDT